MPDPSLLVVVVHYRGLDDTLECLASLSRQTYANMRTLVVDNGSQDALAERLRGRFDAVELARMDDNLGWSGGNNAGIRLALERGLDWVCLLNNDTALPPDAVARLMATAAALGPCLLHPAIDSYDAGDGVQLDPSVGEPGFLTATPVPQQPGLYAVDAINGACLLVHADVFRRIGLIDERFFLLCEDADFGRRAVTAGFAMYCDVGARIRHKESRAFGGRRTPVKTYYGVRNILLFHEKHTRAARFLPVALRHLFWTVRGNAVDAGLQRTTFWPVLRWSFSRDRYASAVRLGVRDYVLHRFGRIRQADAAALASPRRMPAMR